MSTYILTNMFPNGFNKETAKCLKTLIRKRNRFAFVASEFEVRHEVTDHYFQFFLSLFEDIGIHFDKKQVVDGRMTKEEAQNAIREADVVWLSGGDTPTQYHYFETYDLIDVIKNHTGVIIGISAGSINLSKIVICSITKEHEKPVIYPALGCVDLCVRPHFNRACVPQELLDLTNTYEIYGLCDDALIVCSEDRTEFYGEVYLLYQGQITPISK